MIPPEQKLSKQSIGVRSLHALLVDIIKNPKRFKDDTELQISLKRQSSLSRLTRTLENAGEYTTTYPMSLNTLKTYANRDIEGGFYELDNLRKKAKKAIERLEEYEHNINKRSKSGLTRKVDQLESELEMHRQTITILIRALSEAMNSFNNIRNADDRSLRDKRTHDAKQSLRAITSLNVPPFNFIDNESFNHSTPIAVVADINSYRRKT